MAQKTVKLRESEYMNVKATIKSRQEFSLCLCLRLHLRNVIFTIISSQQLLAMDVKQKHQHNDLLLKYLFPLPSFACFDC